MNDALRELVRGTRSLAFRILSLAAHLWLESHGSAPADGHESALRKFLLWAQENNPDPAYGGGFRKARAAYRKYGLQRVLDHVAATADFPL